MKIDAAKIREFLLERLRASAKRRGISPDLVVGEARVIEIGVIDSMGFLELVTGLEEHFRMRIDFSTVDPERFTTLDGLVAIAAQAGENT